MVTVIKALKIVRRIMLFGTDKLYIEDKFRKLKQRYSINYNRILSTRRPLVSVKPLMYK